MSFSKTGLRLGNHRQRVLTAIFSGAVSMLFGLTPTMAQEKEATPVKVDPVRMSPYTQTIPLIGRFVARQRGDVATRVSGAVSKSMSTSVTGSTKGM